MPGNNYWATWAAEAKRIHSPLYETIALQIGDDPQLQEIAAHARVGQPHANLILAAVHYLLLEGVQDPLSAFYPSLNGGVKHPGNPFPLFRDFCLKHRARVESLIEARVTNTNEVARCTSLYPAFDHVWQSEKRDLHMVEIGPSAGFNLNWDRYAYTYRRGGDVVLRRGAPDALLALESELRGDGVPPLSEAMPRVASRVGLELNPVNLQDPEDRLWQKALVFADLTHRLARLDGAIATAIANPVRILFGDALENLGGIVRALPTDGIPVVYHSFVTYQFSPAMRDRLRAILLELSKSRPLYRVSIEWEGTLHPVTVERYESGLHDAVVLADCNPHGAWIEWKGAQARAIP